MSKKLKSETPVAAATTCSRLGDLFEALDAWIEDALKGSKPIGLTLCRARVTITDQHDRIAEIFDALERQNREVARLREALKDATELLEEIMNDEVNHQDEAEKWLRAYGEICPANAIGEARAESASPPQDQTL
jgi:uncharacterized coiled-coil protein SlyX